MPYEKLGKNEPVCIADEVPFDIPESWEIIRLNEIGIYKKGPFGSSLTKSMFVKKGNNAVKVYEQKNAIQKNHKLGDYYISHDYYKNKMSGFTVNSGDIIVSCAGTIGETYIMPYGIELGIINQALMKMDIFAPINIDYFLLYFDYVLKNAAKESSKGSAIKNIPPFDIFKKLILPLPPLSEQERIVAKIEEIMPYIEKYGEKEDKLREINNNISKKLKQSILQEAVQGKLVQQDPNDESANVLLEKIKAEKSQLIKNGKIKKDKNESYIFKRDNSHYEMLNGIERCIDEEIPFDIPENWEWVRLKNTSSNIHYGYTASASVTGDAKLLRITDIQDNFVEWESVPFCSIKKTDLPKYELQNRDIMIARTGGTIGKTYIVRNLSNKAVFASYLIRVIPLINISEEYLKLFMETPLYWQQLTKVSMGTGQPNVNGQALSNLLLPLPPLNEQYRIVSKINNIFPHSEKLNL